MRCSGGRRGFTLTECLVVCAMMALFMVLLAPAIREARDRARSQQCKGNLKQFALALQNYEDIFGAIPTGHVAKTQIAKDESRELLWNSGIGWQTRLLPYLGQAALYNRVDFTNGLPTAAGDLYSQKLAMFRCADDKGSPLVNKVAVLGPFPGKRRSAVVPNGFARSNYVGIAGWDNDWHLGMSREKNPNASADATASNWSKPELGYDFRDGIIAYAGSLELPSDKPSPNARDLHGIFGENSWRTSKQLTDGLSNCLIIGERASPTKGTTEKDVGNAIWAGVPDRSTRVGQSASLGTAFWPINHQMAKDKIPNTTGFNSLHGPYANFLAADGAIHSVSEKIDLALLRRLSIIDDGLGDDFQIPDAHDNDDTGKKSDPADKKADSKANRTQTLKAIKQFEDAATQYAIDHDGEYPEGTSDEVFKVLIKPGKDSVGSQPKPYLNKILKDAWGNQLHYEYPTKKLAIGTAIWSSGPDQKDDQGKKDDIKNWDERP